MRTIDYALARDCDVTAEADGFHGSDHRLVRFEVRHGNKRLRVGLWNIERDRDPAAVVAVVSTLLSSRHGFDGRPSLDVLALVEAGDYVRALAQVPGRLLVAGEYAGQANTCLLVRPGLEISGWFCPRMTRRGWITVRGGHTPPKFLATAKLDGWLRVAVGHRPPSVRWRRRRPHLMSGPVRRVAAMIGHARREVQFIRRHRGPLLVVEDWNATDDARGRYTPHWVARVTGLDVVAPARGTHR